LNSLYNIFANRTKTLLSVSWNRFIILHLNNTVIVKKPNVRLIKSNNRNDNETTNPDGNYFPSGLLIKSNFFLKFQLVSSPPKGPEQISRAGWKLFTCSANSINNL